MDSIQQIFHILLKVTSLIAQADVQLNWTSIAKRVLVPVHYGPSLLYFNGEILLITQLFF